jgi:2-polyprenyl-6-methoxyphenol hydroxylase-like FAD-dependent oxidoreductase
VVARGRRGVSDADAVVVVGAGPTGLTTALQAHDHGAQVRVVERRPQRYRPSRAMIVHARTLESLRPLGVTESLLARGDRRPRAELHLGARRAVAQLSDVRLPDTAFPHLTLVRQMDVEDVLTAALEARGVDVERGVEVVAAREDGSEARVTLRRDGRTEETSCRFLVGCDGPGSTVRRAAGIGWRGGPYGQEVVLADAELDGDLTPGVLHVAVGAAGLVFVFALGEGATWRILATRPERAGELPFGQPGEEVPASDVQGLLDAAGLGVALAHLRWSAQVRLQHRLASSFRQGPLFLAGDAAHAHSPAAGQGMNTGILDGVNLGWKLAFAGGGGQHAPLLDSYDHERRPVARQVLALTHLLFFAEASTSPLPAFLRGTLLPWTAPTIPLLMRQQLLMAPLVRLLSQGWVRYRHSPLSTQGRRGGPGPRPGDRLPDEDVTYDGRRTRLHEVTARPGVHVLLQSEAEPVDETLVQPHVSVHRIVSWPGRGLLAVRPDGHVGLRCGAADPMALRGWLETVGAGHDRAGRPIRVGPCQRPPR